MTEKEKVIKGLESHLKELSVGKTCFECPYCGDNPCEIQLIANAIVLLKDQEAIEPKEIVNEHFSVGDYRRTIGWLCGKCGKTLMGDGDYCSYCGQKVKWDD